MSDDQGTDQVPWLNEREEHLWRTWVRLNAEIAAILQRELSADSNLSMPDLEVLVHLTDAISGQTRVSDLAELLQWDRSRLSHHLKRMETRELVHRLKCKEDGRGSYVAVTPAGRAALGQAAPGHVRTVRRLLFDHLTPLQVRDLSGVLETVASAVLAPRSTNAT